jgi:hypothetical protein
MRGPTGKTGVNKGWKLPTVTLQAPVTLEETIYYLFNLPSPTGRHPFRIIRLSSESEHVSIKYMVPGEHHYAPGQAEEMKNVSFSHQSSDDGTLALKEQKDIKLQTFDTFLEGIGRTKRERHEDTDDDDEYEDREVGVDGEGNGARIRGFERFARLAGGCPSS